ncbi:MAG: universal stress protein [Planctomycetes bacterium]|nr:universal stress protein [Planctomycetota bacterium]
MPPQASLPSKILVAVDAEGMSDHAARAALRLARAFEAKLEFLHASAPHALLEMYWPDSRVDEKRVREMALAKKHLTQHLSELLSDLPQGPKSAADALRVVPGKATKTLLARVREMPADLLVLGASRRRAILDFGSTARSVLAKAECPVWIQSGPSADIRKILVPLDLSDESLLALSFARTIAPRLSARIQAYHAYDLPAIATVPWDASAMIPDFETMRRASKKAFEDALAAFDWQGIEHDATFVDGHPSESILEAARSADLVVMGTHGRTGFASTVLGSVAQQVARHAQVPVVVVRKHDRVFEA